VIDCSIASCDGSKWRMDWINHVTAVSIMRWSSS